MKKTLFKLFVIFLLVTTIFLGIELYKKITTFNYQKYSNLLALDSDGSLINDYSNLEDSKITGDNYSFDTSIYPYYDLLNQEEKRLYQQIYANFDNLETTFVPVIETDKTTVDKVIESVLDDHPEIFWMGESYSYKYTNDGICRQIRLKFNNLVDNFEINKSRIEDEANKIVNNARNLNTDYEKEKYVHNQLIYLLNYNSNSEYNQTLYSALVNNTTVCAGYAKSFQYIMQKLNIPTYYVTGVSKGEEHAWNIVKLDGYYNVDVTWNDATKYQYQFFNITDQIFNNSHERGILSSNLPRCNTTTYQYTNNNNKDTNTNTRIVEYTREEIIKEEEKKIQEEIERQKEELKKKYEVIRNSEEKETDTIEEEKEETKEDKNNDNQINNNEEETNENETTKEVIGIKQRDA